MGSEERKIGNTYLTPSFNVLFKTVQTVARLILSKERTDIRTIVELFFCKKIPLSRRVEYVMDGSMDQ